MKCLCVIGLLCVLPLKANAVEVFSQPPSAGGGQYKSAWYAPDGLNSDEYVWDAFTLSSSTAITQIQWRGAYTNYLSGAGLSPVYDFTVAIYASIPGGSQPDVVSGRLVRYQVGSNAGETPAGSAGGVLMYDYAYTLPSPFQAVAGTKYWVQIYAWQALTPTFYWPPDWSFARGTGGDNSHFRRVGGTGGSYTSITGDCAFKLFSSDGPSVTISASASPSEGGTVSGAGAYPVNSTVSLTATPNTGWGFVNWTQNGSPVSANAHYTFTATVDRTLVANFAPSYSITTAASPGYGGTTTGDGVYIGGSNVTLIATPNPGFIFAGWSDGGTTATHSFTVTADMILTAFFDSATGSVTFDFDNAPVHTSLPIDLTVNGLTAHFSATGSGFSIQPANTMGFTPAGFSGLCLYPGSVSAADLLISFSEGLTDFSILYSPHELGCDTSATMRVTAYVNGVYVATNTSTAPNPGTWPTGTLSLTAPAGFNSVVVHYDARPATCQDWGPIFLADIMTVTRVCAPASILQQPVAATVCTSLPASFSVIASGSGAFTYQWTRNDMPIDSIANPSVLTDLLELSAVTAADEGAYRCVVTNDCGTATSDPASLTVPSPVTPDLDADCDVDAIDLALFDTCAAGAGVPYKSGCALPLDVNGRTTADFDKDGDVDLNDFGVLQRCYSGTGFTPLPNCAM